MRAIHTFLTLKILANCQMSTGSLMTRQTYDRAPRLTKLATAHISKGAIAKHRPLCMIIVFTVSRYGNFTVEYLRNASSNSDSDSDSVIVIYFPQRT